MNRVGKWFPVDSISFPRSGHKLTVDLVTKYFGPEFVYQGHRDGSILTPGVHFQKNHDFDLDVPFHLDRKHLVQVRDPFCSLHSWHKMTVRLDNIPDDTETFRRIAREKMNYLRGFLEKWVFADNVPNRMILKYRDLVEVPAESLRRLVEFFGETPSDERISQVLQEVKVNPPREDRFFL